MSNLQVEALRPDEKGLASFTMKDVIASTSQNFPDPRFQPEPIVDTSQYFIGGIDPSPYQIWLTADGIGTKPEPAERLYAETLRSEAPDPSFYEGLAFDTFAMIEGDVYRWGGFLLGIAEILDLNSAEDHAVISALARGAKKACDEGHFALINGETAELGYRTSGYGDTRVNWNAVGLILMNREKLVLGDKISPGQPVVAFREDSIRSNGLSKARAILEASFLQKHGYPTKKDYLHAWLKDNGYQFDPRAFLTQLSHLVGHNFEEQVLVPWHEQNPDVTREILRPSRLYGPVIYDALGGVDGEKLVDITGMAHITGGGVPEKGKRMVERGKLGLSLDPIFPDPEAVRQLLEISGSLPEEVRKGIRIDERIACEQWNRGLGYLVVVSSESDAIRLIEIAQKQGCEAGIAGKVIDKPEIQWRGHTWKY